MLASALALVLGVVLLLSQSQTPAPETPAPVGAARDEPLVPLERLLRPSVADPGVDPLRGEPLGTVAGPEPEPGALKDAIGIERRSAVSHRGTRVDDTEVSVSVPIGESVKVRGGVRVQERHTGDEPEPESRPIVGVEVEY